MSGADSFCVSADAYDRFMGRYSRGLASALIDFAGVKTGARALDVGCGPGALTAALAESLGASSVVGADPSAPFVEACRARMPGVEVALASAETLPFDDDSFDVTLSQLAVNFMSDPIAGVGEMRRVTRSGGLVGACVWDYGGGMTLLRAFWQAARDVDPQRGAAADEARGKRWGSEAQLRKLWQDAGLQDVRSGSLRVSANYADFDELWSPLEAGVGPAGAFCKSLDCAGRAALRAALHGRLGVSDGPFELRALAWAVAGTVPRVPARSIIGARQATP
jgi:ubiquinone/menaquinone biosynthesis C-methylase UbiE